MAKTYDVKRYELAKAVLDDETQLEVDERELLTAELAQEIQQTIEDFTDELRPDDIDDNGEDDDGG